MSNVKYQRAPQEEPADEAQYSQAPPSYTDRDEATSSLLHGAPRSEDDNIPDDFKYGQSVADSTIEIRMQFIRKVYAILLVQIIATTALSAVSMSSASYQKWTRDNSWMLFVSLFGAIGFMLLTFWKRKSYPVNLVFLGAFTMLEAYTISVITTMYDSRIVLEALVFTVGIFLALTLFACQTKYDFTNWMPYLFGALWVMVLFGFMAMFFPFNSTVELVYGVVGALVFSGYILVDTQLVLRHYHVEEEIAAAISLYLDIINLFLSILRILNNSQNN